MRIVTTVLVGLALSACTASVTPNVTGTASPLTDEVPARVTYRNVVGNYTHRTVTEPRSWGRSNAAQAPEGDS